MCYLWISSIFSLNVLVNNFGCYTMSLPDDVIQDNTCEQKEECSVGSIRVVLRRTTTRLVMNSALRKVQLKVGRQIVRGITAVLDELCAYEPVSTSQNVQTGRGQTHFIRSRGKITGTRVDKELTYYLEYRKLPPQPHIWTCMVVRAAQKWGWTPVAAQVPVGCNALRVGTLIDGIFLDECGRLILVEFKTGCANWSALPKRPVIFGRKSAITKHLIASGSPLPMPYFRNRNQTVQSYCQLQAAATLGLFCRTFPTLSTPAMYVVRVHNDGVDRHRVEPWAEGVMQWLGDRINILQSDGIEQ